MTSRRITRQLPLLGHWLLTGLAVGGCQGQSNSADSVSLPTSSSVGSAAASSTSVPPSASSTENNSATDAAPPTEDASSPATNPCGDANLTWRTAHKTWYTSYPDPGSEECVEFNGCTWAGQFAACDGKLSEAWVAEHDIVAAFPDFQTLALHDLCLRSGDKTLIVTVLDTCADSDCDGCCSENRGDADQLIDLERYTNERWGVEDGLIEWADLGPTRGNGCK
jgi:hypothetical protein